MNASLTTENKRLLKGLLALGRWGNESEIIRYGLHLVAREVQAEQERSLAPISPGVLARAYKKLGPTDFAEDRAMAQASAYPRPGELDA